MKRYAYNAAGSISLVLGILGMFLPLIPTVPLLLLSAACYARGSESFYNWLLNHPVLGPPIQNYRAGAGMPVRAKVMAIILVWTSILLTVSFALTALWLRILLLLLAAGITAYLLRLPTTPKETESSSADDL